MPARFYTKKELIELLDISEDYFHDEVKKTIRKDFKEDLKPLGFNNPDILLDEKFLMTLAEPNNHNNCLETFVNIFDYI